MPRPESPHQRTRTGCVAVCATLTLLGAAVPSQAAAPACAVQSGPQRTPVIELYTSEGCSSCPPADQWLSTLKDQSVVAQAFHVGYWDYIGWVDRFASPTHVARQRDVAVANRQGGIYTPQVVRDGHDWRAWRFAFLGLRANEPARASITLQRMESGNGFTARVTPAPGVDAWAAYWTVTEHGHASRVRAGENRGEFLHHDFVVRQYTPVGRYQGSQTLGFASIAAQPGHPRQINLVVFNPRDGEPLQAVSLRCPD
ncbi:MAG: DUF1223 domain-containing protein [Burkholderiales bacterium]|nr:DUF1223 domain-containing protein [Burkholderiales bacterium]